MFYEGLIVVCPSLFSTFGLRKLFACTHTHHKESEIDAARKTSTKAC